MIKQKTSIAAIAGLLFAAGLQAAADQAAAESVARVAEELQAESALVQIHYAPLAGETEPCINGGVSASGVFESQALEDAVERLAREDAPQLLAESAYFRAFNAGQVELTD